MLTLLPYTPTPPVNDAAYRAMFGLQDVANIVLKVNIWLWKPHGSAHSSVTGESKRLSHCPSQLCPSAALGWGTLVLNGAEHLLVTSSRHLAASVRSVFDCVCVSFLCSHSLSLSLLLSHCSSFHGWI